MKLNFTNIANGKATMLAYKHIGNDADMGMGIDGNNFANEVLFLNEHSDCNEIEVRINSVGGSVSEGLSICSAILNSTKPVTTIIDGMAYSMAGVIAMCGHKKKMVDYGTFMMHNASGGSNQDVLDLITNSLAKIFENTTALTLELCRDLMEKETWMSAEECLKMGLIDEVIKTTNKKPIGKTVAELHNFYNKLINTKKMLKLTNKFNLSNEATEDAILAEVEKIEAEKANAVVETETLKNEVEELKAKLKVFEDAKDAADAAEKLEVIENAIKEKKTDESKKEYFVNSTMSAGELKDLFGALKVNYTPVFNAGENKDERLEWTYSDWAKKDPKGLEELAVNNKPAFDNLISKIETVIKSKK